MENRTIEMYDGMVYGVKVSEHGLERGYLDFRTLSEIMGACIFNGSVREATPYDWEMLTGVIEEDDELMSDYIISRYGYHILRDLTDEVVFYNENLDIYVWGLKRWGTDWSYELTDIKLIEQK